jgi:hypothetical protein
LVAHQHHAEAVSRWSGASARFWVPMRAAMFRKQSGRCYFCKRDMTPIERISCELRHSHDHLKPTVEHLRPVSRGGGERDCFNLVLACHYCNNAKGDLTDFEFALFIAFYGCYPSSLFRWAYARVNGHEHSSYKDLPPTKLIRL